MSIAERDHVQGTREAPLVLVEYGDYQCPHCGEAHALVKEIQRLLGQRLCFVFRHFPLTTIHPFAAHAAEAAEAAGAQGTFWPMHDLLFENQHELRDEALASYAASLGLDARRMMDEIMNGTHVARVREDFRTGVRSGVNGTPSLFINGVRFDGEVNVASLLEALTNRMPAEQ